MIKKIQIGSRSVNLFNFSLCAAITIDGVPWLHIVNLNKNKFRNLIIKFVVPNSNMIKYLIWDQNLKKKIWFIFVKFNSFLIKILLNGNYSCI